jgi:hypothetical protein
MVPHNERDSVTLCDESPNILLTENQSPPANGAAAEERVRALLKDESSVELFLHYLMLALDAWHV